MKPPVFVVGCPRSGTSLLYHMLLSSGGFAVFRTEMNAFNLVGPIFGDLRSLANRRRLMREWLRSKAFQVSGLDAATIEARVLAECRGAGDLLRIVMEEIARAQGVDRWADSTPVNVLWLREIKAAFPDAQIVHLIRDGRDVAVSLDKLGWTRPLPWARRDGLAAGALYWQWMVEAGQRLGRGLGRDYREVSFEALVNCPEETLAELGEFLHHDLSYSRIQEVAVGAVAMPSSSFGTWGQRHVSPGVVEQKAPPQAATRPVGRWRSLPEPELARIEALIGPALQQCGYVPVTPPAAPSMKIAITRAEYRLLNEAKHWAKTRTRLLRWFVRYGDVLIDK